MLGMKLHWRLMQKIQTTGRQSNNASKNGQTSRKTPKPKWQNKKSGFLNNLIQIKFKSLDQKEKLAAGKMTRRH